MADQKISALTGATTPLAGTEVLPIVQSGSTVKVAVSNLTAGRAVATGALTVTGALSSTVANATVGFRAIATTGRLVVYPYNDAATGVVVNSMNTAESVYQPMSFQATSFTVYSPLSVTGLVTFSNYGVGTATFSATGVISSVSDETWKIKDGVPTNPDAMLKKLEPGYWYYNDEKKEIFGADRQLGFYAQNVNFAIGPEAAPKPEFITKTTIDGSDTTITKPWGYYDRSVLAITVMSLQKALATIETLTDRILILEKK